MLNFLWRTKRSAKWLAENQESNKMKTDNQQPITVAEAKSEATLAAPSGSASTSVTQSELAAAFTEWERRYREEPDRFMSEASKLLKQTPKSYGEACAPYLLKILAEQRA